MLRTSRLWYAMKGANSHFENSRSAVMILFQWDMRRPSRSEQVAVQYKCPSVTSRASFVGFQTKHTRQVVPGYTHSIVHFSNDADTMH